MTRWQRITPTVAARAMVPVDASMAVARPGNDPRSRCPGRRGTRAATVRAGPAVMPSAVCRFASGRPADPAQRRRPEAERAGEASGGGRGAGVVGRGRGLPGRGRCGRERGGGPRRPGRGGTGRRRRVRTGGRRAPGRGRQRCRDRPGRCLPTCCPAGRGADPSLFPEQTECGSGAQERGRGGGRCEDVDIGAADGPAGRGGGEQFAGGHRPWFLDEAPDGPLYLPGE